MFIYFIGSYPRTYYESAIASGRILVSGNKVDCDYKIKGGDELSHTVHRHEPAVGLADDYDCIIDTKLAGSESKKDTCPPPVQIVYEDDSVLIVDKPATLPIHPCGGYNYNSLFEILSHWKPESYGSGKLFTVHRLDRLTSGLVVIAKSSNVARSLSKCITDRDGCEKVYLARVKGNFPMKLLKKERELDGDGKSSFHPWEFRYNGAECKHDPLGEEECYPNKRIKNSIPPPCQYGETTFDSESEVWSGGLRIPIVQGNKRKDINNNNTKVKQSYAGLGYWITNGKGEIINNATLQDLCKGTSIAKAIGQAAQDTANTLTTSANESLLWLNFACPCRISSHKNGVCEAGSFSDMKDDDDRVGIKSAETSFAFLSYDEVSDTSLVLAKPVTGRTHQIRLHLQKLGHPIANDHCYGGELWFGDEEGKEACRKSKEWLDQLDQGEGGTCTTNADTPATEAEIYHSAANFPREEGESIQSFIEKTCVWCARCHGGDCLKNSSNDSSDRKQKNKVAVFRRTLMEYLVRSQGIWLHALQYTLKTVDGTNGQSNALRYRTNLPSWARY